MIGEVAVKKERSHTLSPQASRQQVGQSNKRQGLPAATQDGGSA